MIRFIIVPIAAVVALLIIHSQNLYAQTPERQITAPMANSSLANQANIAERVYAQELDYQKALKLWKTREIAESEVNRLGLTPQYQTRESYIGVRVSTMEAALNTKSFGSTLLGAVTQDALAVTQKGAAKSLNWLFNNLPELKPEYQKGDEYIGQEMILAAADASHPKHKFALDLMSRYVGWQPTQPIHRQKKMVEAFDRESIKKYLHLSDEHLKDVMDSLETLSRGAQLNAESEKRLAALFQTGLKNAFAQQQEQLKKMKKDIDEKGAKSEFWTNLDPRQQAEYNSKGFYEMDQGLRGMAGIARLMNSNEVAGKLYQSAAIFSAVRTSILESSGMTIAKNPGTYLNLYVGIALAINDFMASGKKSEMAALYAQLREIAQQIVELRKEMIERFDLLDMKMRSQFEQTSGLLKALASGTDRTESQVSYLQKTLTNSHFEIMTGIRTLWASQEITKAFDCLTHRQSANMVAACSVYYYTVAQNAAPSSPGGTNISAVELAQMRENLLELDPALPIRAMVVHPATWLYSANAILQLYKLNSDKILFANTAPVVQGSFSLIEMINSGKELVTSLQGLLGVGTQDNFRLNTVLLDKLLESYREDILHNFRNGEKLGRTPDGPNPFVGVAQIPHETEFNFYNQNIDFCSDAPVKAVRINEKNYRDDRHGTGPYNVAPYKKASTRRTFELLTPGFAKGSSQITALLPRDVLWALIMGKERVLNQDGDFANVTVTPCWKEISIPRFQISSLGFKGQVSFELNVNVTYQRFGAHKKTFTVVRSRYSEDFQNRSADLSVSPHESNCNFIWRKWNAYAFCPHDNKTGHHWEPIAHRFNEVFKPEVINSSDYREFQMYFQQVQNDRQRHALRKFEEQYAQSNARSINVDSKRLLFLTLFLGSTSNSGSVNDLLSYISLRLPSNREAAELGLHGVPLEKVESALTERINDIREKFQELASDPTLKARVSDYELAIRGLERLKSGRR